MAWVNKRQSCLLGGPKVLLDVCKEVPIVVLHLTQLYLGTVPRLPLRTKCLRWRSASNTTTGSRVLRMGAAMAFEPMMRRLCSVDCIGTFWPRFFQVSQAGISNGGQPRARSSVSWPRKVHRDWIGIWHASIADADTCRGRQRSAGSARRRELVVSIPARNRLSPASRVPCSSAG